MSFPKLLGIFALLLFALIAIAGLIKWAKAPAPAPSSFNLPVEVELESEAPPPLPSAPRQVTTKVAVPAPSPPRKDIALPEADRTQEFFNLVEPKFPIVQTVTYKSRTPWQNGRPAWLSDYASHYSTSRHFIARSLNGKPDYFKQDVAEGDRFNVLHPDKNISFHLLIDTSRCKMWFYYIDNDSNERVLVKTYAIGLGRIDNTKPSGMLTPLGTYTLGSKVAIYKPKVAGFYNGEKVELIRVFGTRWIPFDKEVGECTAPAEKFGIHGVPWIQNERGELVEYVESLGKYESDGCIRLATEDIEELFAIIISRPTTVELVRDFYEAELPGEEKASRH